jgi:hypothetical protein
MNNYNLSLQSAFVLLYIDVCCCGVCHGQTTYFRLNPFNMPQASRQTLLKNELEG